MAYDDHVVVTGHFGDTYYLTIEDTFNVFAAFTGDIDTIVFDGNPFDGGVGLYAKAGGNEAGRYLARAVCFILTKLGCQFDGCVVEFIFFSVLPGAGSC